MIAGFVRGQALRLSVPRIAADTIDYLTAKFLFQSSDWDGFEKWAHFAKGEAAYDIRLTDDEITADAHLNLSAGKWNVYLHGNRYADSKVVQRVTTETQTLDVFPTGTLDGEPFPTVPPSAGEQVIAAATAAEAGAKAAAAEARQAVEEAAQYEPEVFCATYGVTPYAEVKAAYDAGKLCVVQHILVRCIAIRTASATERFIEFTGTSYYNDHYIIRVWESDRWSVSNVKLLTKELDVIDFVGANSTSDEVPTAKATYDAIQTYSDPAIAEALTKAKESGEFDGADGRDGQPGAAGKDGTSVTVASVTESTEDGGENVVTFSDGKSVKIRNGKPGAKGDPGDDYVLTEADKQEIAGMIPGGGGGSGTSVQPDWNQNDPTAADYIKNRICYEETKWLLEETDVVFEDMGGMLGAVVPLLGSPAHNQEITVNFGGTDYKTTCRNIGGPGEPAAYVFGNLSIMGQADTGEPFFGIALEDSGSYVAQLGSLNGVTSATVSIRYLFVQTIDRKYIGVGEELETINLIDEGFSLITYGETFSITPSSGLYARINQSILAKGKARFHVKMTILYPELFMGGTTIGGMTEREYDIVMTASGISTETSEYWYELYAFWRGYILYMSVNANQISFRILKFTDMYYEN